MDPPTSALQAILTAGLICGILDGLSAIAISPLLSSTPLRVFQGIASGLLGRRAFQGGAVTIALGVLLHFVVAFGASAVYYCASRFLDFLIDHALLYGILYGITIHLFMTFVVIPLSAIGRRPFVPRSFIALTLVHMIIVGPSISLTIRHFEH